MTAKKNKQWLTKKMETFLDQENGNFAGPRKWKQFCEQEKKKTILRTRKKKTILRTRK